MSLFEFEKFEITQFDAALHSILSGVSFEYITQHYQNMMMHRYPSELCDLFKRVFPEGRRHADKARIDEGNGATLYYHYLMHGFRNYGVKVLDVVESESHIHPTRLVWNTYLQDTTTTRVETFEGFLASNNIPARSLDIAIFSMYDPKNSEMNSVENVYRIIARTIHLLKPSGFLFLEGFSFDSVHFITSTLSSLYLYPKMCRPFIFMPLGSTRGSSYAMVGIRRVFEGDYNVLTPGMYPLVPIPRRIITTSPYKTFVLVTSAMKSIGNLNIFSEDTRFRQLLHSVRTIHQHIPNAHVCISELSELSPEHVTMLRENGVDELQTFKGLEGVPKSLCEALVLKKVFQEVIQNRPEFDSVVKLSGRYFLTDDFKTYDPTQIICKRIRPQEVMTRFFSIPKHFFGRFSEVLDVVANRPEVQAKTMDIEHAIGQACPEMDEASTHWPRLGVAGFYAGNAHMLVE